MMIRLLLSLIFIGAAYGSKATGKASAPHASFMDHQLAVRGGAGPIDPDLAGKLMTGAFLLQGSAFTLAPEPNAKLYGVNNSPLVQAIISEYGAYGLAIGIMGYALLIKGTDTNTAIGCGFLTLVIKGYEAILNDIPGKFGMNRAGIFFSFCLLSLSAYSMLTNQDYASTVVKAVSYYGLANGVFAIISPVKFATTWGHDETNASDTSAIVMFRNWGFALSGFCAVILTLLEGVKPLKALGYGVSAYLVSIITQNFVTKHVAELGMNVAAQYFWMLFFATIVGTLVI